MGYIKVDIKIKESRGEYSPVIDRYKGSAEDGAKFLMTKYGGNKKKKLNFFEWLYEPFNVIDEELKKR